MPVTGGSKVVEWRGPKLVALWACLVLLLAVSVGIVLRDDASELRIVQGPPQVGKVAISDADSALAGTLTNMMFALSTVALQNATYSPARFLVHTGVDDDCGVYFAYNGSRYFVEVTDTSVPSYNLLGITQFLSCHIQIDPLEYKIECGYDAQLGDREFRIEGKRQDEKPQQCNAVDAKFAGNGMGTDFPNAIRGDHESYQIPQAVFQTVINNVIADQPPLWYLEQRDISLLQTLQRMASTFFALSFIGVLLERCAFRSFNKAHDHPVIVMESDNNDEAGGIQMTDQNQV
jgi:hypothetical protein